MKEHKHTYNGYEQAFNDDQVCDICKQKQGESREKSAPKHRICTKTLTGRHLFMPEENTLGIQSQIWRAHGIEPLRCLACGMYDDTHPYEPKE